VGKERGYSLIVDARAGVIYGSPESDLTEEVIKEFDAASKKPAAKP
jgi:Skp family chaperone for outer membrane proteins